MVASRHVRDRQRPLDGDIRRHRIHAAFVFAAVRGAVEINKLGVIVERLKAMCKAGRDQQHRSVGFRQLTMTMLSVGGGTIAKIDGDIQDRTADAADDLGLGFRRALKMQPANTSPLPRERVVALRDLEIDAVVSQLVTAKQTRKEATFVCDRLEIEAHHVGKI